MKLPLYVNQRKSFNFWSLTHQTPNIFSRHTGPARICYCVTMTYHLLQLFGNEQFPLEIRRQNWHSSVCWQVTSKLLFLFFQLLITTGEFSYLVFVYHFIYLTIQLFTVWLFIISFFDYKPKIWLRKLSVFFLSMKPLYLNKSTKIACLNLFECVWYN